jgi:hypothetical protein
MIRATFVKISRRQVGQREFDCITVNIGDLHLRCDLVCDRDIRLARELANQHGAWFMFDDYNAERVKAALAGRYPADELVPRKEVEPTAGLWSLAPGTPRCAPDADASVQSPA